MSGSRGFAILAFGLVIGLGLFPFLGLILDYTNPPIPSDAELIAGQEQDYYGEQYASRDPSGSVWRSSGYFVESGDTLAQWIMMTFTIIAAALLLGTLMVTLRMARDTRDIGEAQVRAWVSIKSATLEINEETILRLSIKNTGNSPARNVSCTWECPVLGPNSVLWTANDIAAGSENNEPIPIPFSLSMVASMEFLKFLVTIGYTDVFGANQVERWWLGQTFNETNIKSIDLDIFPAKRS